MRLIRLYVEQPLAVASRIALPEQAAQHAVRVLRLRSGDRVVVFNGDGIDYQCELTDVERHTVNAQVLEAHAAATESALPLVLAQCMARGEKMDLIVQKATELGVHRIVPLLSERSEVRLDAARSDKRVQHWRAVAASACEQCGRARLPQIEPPLALRDWLAKALPEEPLRLALLPEASLSARQLRMPGAGALLVVGPEGGLGDQDLAALRANGFTGLGLGPRILRTETAGLAALTALQALFGDMSPQ